jgi:hypothetical protein
VGLDRATLTAAKGFRFIRVYAQIKNISKIPDPPYTLWALGDLKRTFQGIFGDHDQSKPSRLAIDEFVYVVTNGGDFIPCGHVYSTCGELRKITMNLPTKEGGGAQMFVGSYVDSGTSFNLDAAFAVPEQISELKLLVLGSSPVSFKVP